jgi:hypothetical protein
LLKLVRQHLDEPVAAVMQRHGYVLPKMSELVVLEQGVAESVLDSVAMDSLGGLDWVCPTPFSDTCSDLITLVSFCAEHRSDDVRVGLFEAEKGEVISRDSARVGRGVRRGVRAGRRQLVDQHLLSAYLRLQQMGRCVACCRPVEEKQERERLASATSDDQVKRLLREGGQFSSFNRGSAIYCDHHAEGTAGSAAAKRARAMRTRLLSLVRAMGRKEVAPLLNPLFPPDLELEFAALAAQSPLCASDLDLVARKLPDMLCGADTPQGSPDASAHAIFEAIKRMFASLQLRPQPYAPPVMSGAVVLTVASASRQIAGGLWRKADA